MRSVIVDWRRSPFTKAHKGALSIERPDDIAGQVIRELIRNSSIEANEIDDIIVGCAYPEGEQGYNIGRLMTFLGGLPAEVPGSTINRLCGSSMHAVLSAAANIESGWGDCYLCAGVESMSRVKRRGFNWSPHPGLELDWPEAYVTMGQTAENIADGWGVSRAEQEAFALDSHIKANAALEAGAFEAEIIPIIDGQDIVASDGCIRSDSTLEAMAALKPVFS